MQITYIVLAAIFGAAPHALARFSSVIAGAVATATLTIGVVGIATGLRPYPWTDLVVAIFALSAGVSIGRVVPPRRRPFAILLVVLAALDTAQVIAAGPVATPPPPPSAFRSWTMVLLQTPLGNGDIGFGDLVVISAIGEHWRRRGGGVLLSLAPGIIGLAAAVAFASLAYKGIVPLLGFVLGGWLVVEIAVIAYRKGVAA